MEPNQSVPSDERLYAEATRLVSSARQVGAQAIAYLAEQGAAPAAADAKRWDFFATAAALTVGIGALMKLVSEDKFARIYETFLPNIEAWSAQGEDVLLDCHKFVAGESIPGMPREKSLGMWVLANSYHRQLENEETELAHRYGEYFVEAMQDWWVKQTPAHPLQ